MAVAYNLKRWATAWASPLVRWTPPGCSEGQRRFFSPFSFDQQDSYAKGMPPVCRPSRALWSKPLLTWVARAAEKILGKGSQHLGKEHPLGGGVVDVLGDGDQGDIVSSKVGQGLQGHPQITGPSVQCVDHDYLELSILSIVQELPEGGPPSGLAKPEVRSLEEG